MFKSFTIVALVSVCLGACSTIEGIESNLGSPATTQAAANIGQFVKAFACGLNAAAAAAQGVEAQSYNGSPIVDNKGQQITAIVYASSTAACQLLGGVVTSATAVSVPAVVVAK